MCQKLLTLHLGYNNEYVLTYLKESLIVSLFNKRVREDPDNYSSITLLSVIGKLYGSVNKNVC